MKINEIRLSNTEYLIKIKCNGIKAKFARKIGRTPQGIARWWAESESQRRAIGDRIARDIEMAFSLNEGWMDSLHKDYELEEDKNKRLELQISNKDTFKVNLSNSCTIDDQLALTLISTKVQGVLMLLSTDKDAYAYQFIGHHSNPTLSNDWGLAIEPNTPLTKNEYAIIHLKDDQMLLRIITYLDDKVIVAMNPLDKQQTTFPLHEITKAEYCYIGIPPSKIIKTEKE